MRCKDLEASGIASPTMSPTLDKIHWRTTSPVMMACSAMVQRLGWLLPQEPMTLLQRVPRLKPLIPLQLKAKPMPWRWMMRIFGHLQLAPSPLWMMIYSLAVEQLGWRQTWPTLWSHLQGARMVRVRKPPFMRPSPCWFYGDCEAPPWLPPGCLQRRNEAIMLGKEGHVESEDREPTTSEDSRETLL